MALSLPLAALLLVGLGCRPPASSDSGFPTVQLGSRAGSSMVLQEGLHRLYVAEPDLPVISVLDATSLARIDEITVQGHAEQLALSPDGGVLYAVDRGASRLVAVDLRTGRQRSVGAGSDPIGVVTDDAGRIYVTDFAGNSVDRYDPDTLQRTRSWSPGFGDDLAPVDVDGPPSRGWDPRDLAFDATRGHLLISHHFVNRISFVDVDSEAVVAAIFGDVTATDDAGDSQGIPYGFGAMAVGEDLAVVPHFLWNPTQAVDPEQTVWPALSLVDLDAMAFSGRLERGAGLDVASDGSSPHLYGFYCAEAS